MYLYFNRGADLHLPQFPTEVVITFTHNHPVMCADALKYRDVSEDTKQRLTELFKRKYGPTQAVEMLKYELLLQHKEDYLVKAADRAICPDVQFAHR